MQPKCSRLGRNIWALAVALLPMLLDLPQAQAADDFYKGKQIKIIVSGGTGVYYLYPRIYTTYMRKHIPGEPTFVIEQMPGASGLVAANYIYNKAPRDGTVLGAVHSHIPTAPLLQAKGAQYDQNQLGWIGNATKDIFTGYVWHTSTLRSLDETKTKNLIVGGQAVGSMSVDMPILMREMLGLKLKIVTGYGAGDETQLALERGEIEGNFGNSYTSLRTAHPEWLSEKKVRLITQFGFRKHRNLPDVPLFLDMMQGDDRKAIELMLARQETAKPFFAPPGIPADRLELLRRAFRAAMNDPDCLAELAKADLEVTEPMFGEELAAFVKQLSGTPPSAVKRLNDIFEKFKEAP